MEKPYYVLDVSIYRVGELYQVELAHHDPSSEAQTAPIRAAAGLNPEALVPLLNTLQEYGNTLSSQLFQNPAVKRHFLQVEATAQASDHTLRMALRIDESAKELQSLRWELLKHPENRRSLATTENLLLSRFLASRDWRPIKLRAQGTLTALIAIAAPSGPKFSKMNLATVDFEGESARIRAALGDVKVTLLGGPSEPLTLDRLVAGIREGADIVYLVCHGVFGRSTGAPTLLLEDESGDVWVTKGEELASRIGEMKQGPRLMVLASCQSAGDGPDARNTVQATLAGRLADAGVPAIVAMQGNVSMETIKKMMPVFFKELLDDGQIDRAMAVARSKVQDRADVWMPALFTRLHSGKIWYTPGFRGDGSEEIWKSLVRPVQHGKLVPILGPGLTDTIHGTPPEIALALAEAHRFPLAISEWDDLPRVTQYLSVKESRYNVVETYKEQLRESLIRQHSDWLPPEVMAEKPKLGKLLALVLAHLQQRKKPEVFRLLSELPASVYVTTAFDPLLELALKGAEREPQSIVSRWRYKKAPATAEEVAVSDRTQKTPLVFHALGSFNSDTGDSLVLTEDDYFDYLIGTVAARLMPAEVESALVDNSLLFLGFRLTDWSFRVLFRLMRSLEGKDTLKNYCHVAVQLDPDMQTMADVEGAKAYLRKYFHDEAQIELYWGSTEEFLISLRDALAKTGGTAAPEAKKANDDLDF